MLEPTLDYSGCNLSTGIGNVPLHSSPFCFTHLLAISLVLSSTNTGWIGEGRREVNEHSLNFSVYSYCHSFMMQLYIWDFFWSLQRILIIIYVLYKVYIYLGKGGLNHDLAITFNGWDLVRVQFSSVQSLSRVRLFETPWIAAGQASQSSLKLMSIELWELHWMF